MCVVVAPGVASLGLLVCLTVTGGILLAATTMLVFVFVQESSSTLCSELCALNSGLAIFLEDFAGRLWFTR